MNQRIPCEAFKKNPDGSWTCIKPVTIKGVIGEIQIGVGKTFTRGMQYMGVDLAELLDKYCT